MNTYDAGAPEAQEAQQVAVHAHNLEAQAHAHAEAQVQAAVQAHSLAAKAQAHAHAQVRPIPAPPLPLISPQPHNMLALAAVTRHWLVSCVTSLQAVRPANSRHEYSFSPQVLQLTVPSQSPPGLASDT